MANHSNSSGSPTLSPTPNPFAILSDTPPDPSIDAFSPSSASSQPPLAPRSSLNGLGRKKPPAHSSSSSAMGNVSISLSGPVTDAIINNNIGNRVNSSSSITPFPPTAAISQDMAALSLTSPSPTASATASKSPDFVMEILKRLEEIIDDDSLSFAEQEERMRTALRLHDKIMERMKKSSSSAMDEEKKSHDNNPPVGDIANKRRRRSPPPPPALPSSSLSSATSAPPPVPILGGQRHKRRGGVTSNNGGDGAPASAASSSSNAVTSPPSAPAAVTPAPAARATPPHSYKTQNVRISLPKQWDGVTDPCGVEIIIKTSLSPAPTAAGRKLRSTLATIAAKNARSPSKQAALWYNLLTVPKWEANANALLQKLFEEGAAPLQVEAVVPIAPAVAPRRPRPAAAGQLTLSQVGMVVEEKSPPLLYQQVNFSQAMQEEARSGELHFRVVFPSSAVADIAQDWLNRASGAQIHHGLDIQVVRDTIPLQCVEVAFDAPSLGAALSQPNATASACVVDELKRSGVVVDPDDIVILNADNDCVAPMRANDIRFRGINSIRYRPRVLLPLHSIGSLKGGNGFSIRTTAKRMCSGCGPACISLRSWCRRCTIIKRNILRQSPSAAYPSYCFHCNTVKDNHHVQHCIASNAGKTFRCTACPGTHRSPICPGHMQPLEETNFGQRVLNLSSTRQARTNRANGNGASSSQRRGASGAPARPNGARQGATVRSLAGGNQRRSYAQAVGGAGSLAPPQPSSNHNELANTVQQLSQAVLMMQQQMALLVQASLPQKTMAFGPRTAPPVQRRWADDESNYPNADGTMDDYSAEDDDDIEADNQLLKYAPHADEFQFMQLPSLRQ